MNKIVLHIPHSSEKLPKKAWENFCLPKEKIKQFVKDIADTKTLKLFGSNGYLKIYPEFSRVFCDVEKYVDDKKEVMSKYGMGVIYTKTNLGETFLKPTKTHTKYVLNNIYYPYHKRLNKVIGAFVENGKKVIIVDCHSFSKDIIMFKDKKTNLPDICVGYNADCDKKLVQLAISYFSNLGYLVKENEPYSGSIIPNVYLKNKPKNLQSIMLEINKTVYIYNKTNFKKLQKEINQFLRALKEYE